MFASKFRSSNKQHSTKTTKTPTESQISPPVNLSISNFGAHDRISTPNLSERKVTATKVKSKLEFKLQSKLLEILAKQNNRIEKLEKLRSSRKSSKVHQDF